MNILTVVKNTNSRAMPTMDSTYCSPVTVSKAQNQPRDSLSRKLSNTMRSYN